MTKHPKHYSEARQAVSELLSLHGQEYNLERKLNGDEHSTFDDNRALGVLAFFLSTQCVKQSAVWEALCGQLITKARNVAILEGKIK
tara:strand:+ start:84 stop:344 length:261 start_codon:yes stop_codon:yes gene_type:complete